MLVARYTIAHKSLAFKFPWRSAAKYVLASIEEQEAKHISLMKALEEALTPFKIQQALKHPLSSTQRPRHK